MSDIAGISGGMSHVHHRHVLQQLYKNVDTNSDGTVSQSELEQAITAGGGSQQSADSLFAALDPNNTGSVAQQQFVTGLSSLLISPQNAAQLIAQQGQDSASATSIAAASATTSADFDPAARFKQGLFTQLDADGDGTLSKNELEQAVTSGGGTAAQADALYAQLDPNGTGAVTEQQFAANFPKPGDASSAGQTTADTTVQDAVQALFQSTGPAAKMKKKLFAQFDTDGDGSLSKSEFEQAITKAGGTTDQADAIFAKLDPNGTGSVTEQQFAANLPNPPPPPPFMMRGFNPQDDGTSSASAAATTTSVSSTSSTTTSLEDAVAALMQSLNPRNAASGSQTSTEQVSGIGGTGTGETAADAAIEQALAALFDDSATLTGATGQGTAAAGAMSGYAAPSALTGGLSPQMLSVLLKYQNATAA